VCDILCLRLLPKGRWGLYPSVGIIKSVYRCTNLTVSALTPLPIGKTDFWAKNLKDLSPNKATSDFCFASNARQFVQEFSCCTLFAALARYSNCACKRITTLTRTSTKMCALLCLHAYAYAYDHDYNYDTDLEFNTLTQPCACVDCSCSVRSASTSGSSDLDSLQSISSSITTNMARLHPCFPELADREKIARIPDMGLGGCNNVKSVQFLLLTGEVYISTNVYACRIS
jgi:hypothetical protein